MLQSLSWLKVHTHIWCHGKFRVASFPSCLWLHPLYALQQDYQKQILSAVGTVDIQKRIRSHDWGWLLSQGDLARCPARSGCVCLLVSQHETAALLSPPAAPFGTPTVPICFFLHWKAVNSLSLFSVSPLVACCCSLYSLLSSLLWSPILILSFNLCLCLFLSLSLYLYREWMVIDCMWFSL